MSDQHEKQSTGLAIIGGGPGGYRAAFMAADLGLEVTLIDPEKNPGGVCLYRGCIPTKALLHLSRLKNEAMEAGAMGMKFGEPEMDLSGIREWKNDVVGKLTGGLGQLVKARKIRHLQGHARFMDSRTIEVNETSGKNHQLTFKHAIIATGVRPKQLPGLEFDGKQILDSSSALEIEAIPDRLLIVGAGYIGLEMAAIYRSLGARITLAELTGSFMPGMDKDLSKELHRAVKGDFEDIYFNTSVRQVKEQGKKLRVTFENQEGESHRGDFDKTLVAVGQAPDHEALGLEHTSVSTDETGYIEVDDQQRTKDENIFAIGDVTGEPLLAHKASHEGGIAAEVIAGRNVVNDAKVIPAVVYTDPEIAVCGLTEKEANEQNRAFKKVRFPWSAAGRALTMNTGRGFTKLLLDPADGRILGAGIIGRNAGDLISEMALAVEMGATAEDVALTVHPHPTLSETLMEAAELFLGHPTHIMQK